MDDETPLLTKIALGLCMLLILYLLAFGGDKKAFINVEKVMYTDSTILGTECSDCEYDTKGYWILHANELANPKGASAHSNTNK